MFFVFALIYFVFYGFFFSNFERKLAYYNTHRKFFLNLKVHDTISFGLGAKTNIARWKSPPSPPNFEAL